MSLIAMAVHDTEENGRTEFTERTVKCLVETVNFSRHRLFIIDNGSCEKTQEVYTKLINYWALNKFPFGNLTIIRNNENIGTAKAINKAWKQRREGEHCIKMDNDVVIHSRNWVEEMDGAIEREPLIGQVGLKRKDVWENPSHENKEFRSQLLMLPHKPGERWIIVEQSKHIIGTCVMHSSALLDKIGFLVQPGLYGYDDVLISWRSSLSGFINVFLPHINIDHIDPGGTEYQGWKERHAGKYSKLVSDMVDEYIAGKSLYHED
jgi:GT2 family glycosyltransferase